MMLNLSSIPFVVNATSRTMNMRSAASFLLERRKMQCTSRRSLGLLSEFMKSIFLRQATSSICWNLSRPRDVFVGGRKLTLCRLQILSLKNRLVQTSNRKESDHREVTASQTSKRIGSGPPPSNGIPHSKRLELSFSHCDDYDVRSSKYVLPPDGYKLAALNVVFYDPEPDSIRQVQTSYAEALESGALLSKFVPRQQSAKDPPNMCYDPYRLASGVLSTALLDAKNLSKLKRLRQYITEVVPNATEWEKRANQFGFTPGNMREILQIACGRLEAHPKQPAACGDPDGNMPHILAIAEQFLSRADTLREKNIISGQAEAIARLVGYSLMRVCEVVHELTPLEVCLSQSLVSTTLIL